MVATGSVALLSARAAVSGFGTWGYSRILLDVRSTEYALVDYLVVSSKATASPIWRKFANSTIADGVEYGAQRVVSSQTIDGVRRVEKAWLARFTDSPRHRLD